LTGKEENQNWHGGGTGSAESLGANPRAGNKSGVVLRELSQVIGLGEYLPYRCSEFLQKEAVREGAASLPKKGKKGPSRRVHARHGGDQGITVLQIPERTESEWSAPKCLREVLC